MNNISFTVFIPCYGECTHLEKTILSLVDQNYPLDIVLCPQGDTDIDYITKKFPFIRVVYLEKPSLYKARIFLFDKSKSDYIYYLDDDDIIPKGMFKYISTIIERTKFLDLYRIPLKTFSDDSSINELREQDYNFNYFFQTKQEFLNDCFSSKYHNGVVHLFIKNKLKPQWFNVDIFQTEDRLITFAIANSIQSDVCVINDAFYLYRKYPNSHSKTLNLLKGRDDFIIANDCLKDYMGTRDLIFNSYAIVLRMVSYLKLINTKKQFNRQNFNDIYSNDGVWFYLNLFLKNFETYREITGFFISHITKLISKKAYIRIKLHIKIKCIWEKLSYGKVEY